MKRFIIGTGSCGNRGWEVPWSAVWKLEAQESWLYNSVQVWSPGNQGNQWCNSHSKTETLGEKRGGGVNPGVWKPENQELQCLRAGKNSLFLCLFVLFWHIGEGGYSLLSLLIQIQIFWIDSHRHTQK